MIKLKGGFTLIEVSLFLAITGLLFLGVTIGVQSSIFQQRFNDSVQNFAEFLRSAYAKTENVQNAGDGNSSQAIYGKLITFGEAKNLNGGTNDGDIFMYDVIGQAKCEGGYDGTLETLKNCQAEVTSDGRLLGQVESYKARWSAAIQNTEGELFKGAILITRHPQSGTIYTFTMIGNTVEINSERKLANYLNKDNFQISEVDFCVNPNGNEGGNGTRADVRIEDGSRNSSGVVVMPDSENKCMNRS